MINNYNLLEYIKSSVFINETLKNNIIMYFDKLSEKQVNALINFLELQRKQMIITIASFKQKEVCDFNIMKTYIEKEQYQKIRFAELSDNVGEEKSILNLINCM